MRLSIIVAIAKNNAIGLNNKLIYWLPNDLKRFKSLTTGHTIIMGRKTFESLPKGALPNRRNIVLSRNGKPEDFPGAELYRSLTEALEQCQAVSTQINEEATTSEATSYNSNEVFIIGGASLYAEALPIADRLCLTYVDDTPAEADTFFPEFNPAEWKEIFREDHDTDEKHAQRYSFIDLERK